MEALRKTDTPDHVYIPNILYSLWKNKFLILLGGMLGAVVSFTFTWFFITPLYEASVTLYVNNSSSEEGSSYITQSDLYASTQLVDTYAAIILSDAILEDVIRDVSLDMTIDDLADILEIGAVNETEVFRVSARHPSPETAAGIVDSIARISPEQISNIVKGSSVTVINYARIPTETAFPNYVLMTVLGFGAGISLIACFLFFREIMDTRIKSVSDFSRWEYPLLANVPDFLSKNQPDYGYGKKKTKRRGAAKKTADFRSCLLSEDTPFAVQEAYKTLRTNIIFSSPDQKKRVILISSTLKGEAKSTTAINLASAFAQNQSKVLLLDCDLRLPSIARQLGLRQSPGLTDLMFDMENGKKGLQIMKNGLHVLPAGIIPPNPTEMLGSKKMEQLLNQFVQDYDYIIIDTPPLETMSDAAILSQFATDVILVVRQDMTESARLDAVIKKLKLAQAKILGFVFTCVVENNGRSYSKYGYRYSCSDHKSSMGRSDSVERSPRKKVCLREEKHAHH